MTDFNKGDFTQQGVDGHVNAKLRLNAKRYVDIDLTSNEEASGCTISGHVYDSLNDITYPIGRAKTISSKSITENGTYNASADDCDGYNPVTVNVPQPTGNIEITENTTEGSPLNIAQYATATVNVAGGGESDWTTAQLTLKPTTNTADYDIPNNVSTKGPVLYNGSYESLDSVNLSADGVIVEIPLYNGSATLILDEFTNAAMIQIEPDVYEPDITGSYTFDDPFTTITGDCVIGIGLAK